MSKKFISWRRVSTQKQGRSGLGIEAQESLINYFVEREGGSLIADYVEVYTGTDLAGCTELRKAMEHCKREGATLIIAKTDRFRNTKEALDVYDKMEGQIYFCDLPQTDKFTLTLFFALAEREALMISIRTKQAFDAKRKRGEAMGGAVGQWGKNTNKTEEDREKQLEFARERMAESKRVVAQNNPHNKAFWEFITDWQKIYGKISRGMSWIEIADELNRRGKQTSSGMEFTEVRARAMYCNCKRLYRN